MSERTKHHPDTCTCIWCATRLRTDLATAETGLKDAQWRLSELRIQLATVVAERDQAHTGWKTTSALAVETQDALEAERAAHAETRKALEASGRALSDECENAYSLSHRLESTRAELARSEARVKAALNHYNGQGSLCDHMREMARLLRG